MIEGLAACFAGLADPRETRRCAHQLIDILVIAVCAVIACVESWEGIELYGRNKRAWLETFLELPNGIPSHDTFRRVFMLFDPNAFESRGRRSRQPNQPPRPAQESRLEQRSHAPDHHQPGSCVNPGSPPSYQIRKVLIANGVAFQMRLYPLEWLSAQEARRQRRN